MKKILISMGCCIMETGYVMAHKNSIPQMYDKEQITHDFTFIK